MSNQVCIHDTTSDSGHTIMSNLFTTGSDGSSCDAFSEILRLNTSTPNSSLEKSSQFGDSMCCPSQGPGSDGGSSGNSTRSTCCTNLRWSSSSTTTETGGYVSCNTSLDGDGLNSVYSASQSMMIPSSVTSSSCNNPYLQNYDIPRSATSFREMRSLTSTDSFDRTKAILPAVSTIKATIEANGANNSDNNSHYQNSEILLQHLKEQEESRTVVLKGSSTSSTSSSFSSSHLPQSSSCSSHLLLDGKSSSSSRLVNTSSCHHNHHPVSVSPSRTILPTTNNGHVQQQEHYQVPKTALANLYLKVSFSFLSQFIRSSFSWVFSRLVKTLMNFLLVLVPTFKYRKSVVSKMTNVNNWQEMESCLSLENFMTFQEI